MDIWSLNAGDSLENDNDSDNKSFKKTIREDERDKLKDGGRYTVEFTDGSGIVLNPPTIARLDAAFRGKTISKITCLR